MTRLQKIDDSNREAHFYLTAEDECFFLHEFTARKGFNFSPGNQFIFNFKKSPLKRMEPHYQHKLLAIRRAISTYRQIFDKQPESYGVGTFVPIPPSRSSEHPEYDDRMWQVVKGIADGTEAEARELIQQDAGYDPAHLSGTQRIKPAELRALYRLVLPAPRPYIYLFDDVLSAGCHFRAAKDLILNEYPNTRVIGFFLARRVFPDLAEDFEVIS